MNRTMALIYYHIPEDGDTLTDINAFAIPKHQDEVTLSDIRGLFPIEGDYHFRFRNRVAGNAVWLDVGNEASTLPTYEGKIIVKVTRITWNAPQQSVAQPPDRKNSDLIQM